MNRQSGRQRIGDLESECSRNTTEGMPKDGTDDRAQSKAHQHETSSRAPVQASCETFTRVRQAGMHLRFVDTNFARIESRSIAGLWARVKILFFDSHPCLWLNKYKFYSINYVSI